MKQNSTAEEEKSRIGKQPASKPASPAEFPLWLVTSFVLGLVSAISLVYYFFVKRSNPKSRSEQVSVPQPLQPEKPMETTHQGLDIIKSKPVFAAPVAKVEESKPQGEWIESLGGLPFLKWLTDQKNFIVGPLLALAVAYLAQGVFDSITGAGILKNSVTLVQMTYSARQWLGAGIYLVAILIWAFTSPTLPAIASVVRPAGRVRIDPSSAALRSFLLFIAITIYLISVVLFLMNGENGFIRILWGIGVVTFFLSQWTEKTTHPEAEESPKFELRNWLILASILLIGFWLRFYQVATIPDDFHGDMASHGWVARDFLLGVQHDIFGFGWTATPTIGFLPAFLTMAVFGNNIFGLQMAAVIGGVFSLLAIYLLTWRFFNSHRLAALTTGLVAINIVHIHFSRIFNMEPWPLSNFAIFLLIDGLKSRRSTSFGLAGICIGFSLLMYTSGRALPFIFVVFLLYAFFFHRSWVTQNMRGFILVVVGIILTMGPALVYYLLNWDIFIQRSREVYLFSEGVMNHLMNKYNTNSQWTVLWTQIKLTLLMFNQSTDTSSQFSFPHPMFATLISPLLLLGFGAALRRWKEAGMVFILIWLAVIAVLGGVLTIDAPFWPRLVGILPAAAFLIALALEQILEFGRKALGDQSTNLLLAIVVVFLTIVGYLNWNQYYQFVKNSASPSTLTGRYIGRLPDDVTACGIISGPQLTVRETSFLAWPHKLVDIAPDAPDSELANCTGTSIVWAISPENISRLDAIRARWPNGILDERYMEKFDYTMTYYLVGAQPPEFESKESFDLFPSFLGALGIVIPLVFAGVLVWFFFQRVLVAIPHGRHPSKIDSDLPAGQEPEDATPVVVKPALFTFPTITPKLAVTILLSVVAVGLGYFGQTFLDQSTAYGLHLRVQSLYIETEAQRQWIAVLFFVVAALLWTFTTTFGAKDPSLAHISQSDRSPQPAVGSPVQIAGAFFTVAAIFLYIVIGDTALVRGLWLAGLIFFLVSLWFKNQSGFPLRREESPVFRWFHVLMLVALLVLAFCLRVYHLYEVPLDLSTDMASVGLGARDYLFGVEQRLFGTGWYYMPRITFVPYAVSMFVAGNNLFGLYFATVIMGTLNILGVYLFVWRAFDRHRLALLTAALVTINPGHINFSRITSYMDPWFFGFFGLFFLVDGLKGRRWVSLALSGMFTAFTLVSYPAGRAIVPMVAIVMACAWFFKRDWITDNYRGLLWMALGLFVTLGPNLVYFFTDWGLYMQRSREVIITNPGVTEHLKFTYQVDSFAMVLWEQIRHSVLLFNYYSDTSAQFAYPHPMFNSFVSPLLLLGFGMSLYRWKKPEFLFLVSSFSFILVTGSILTDNAPTWCRLVGIIPLAALLIALVMDEFVVMLERLSLKFLVPVLLVCMAAFLWQMGALDWKIYLKEVGNVNMIRPEVLVARYLDTLPDDITACGLTNDYLISQEEIRFMGWPRSIVVVPVNKPEMTTELCPADNVVWIVDPAYTERLVELQTQWPGGVLEDHINPNGANMFISYLVSGQHTP